MYSGIEAELGSIVPQNGMNRKNPDGGRDFALSNDYSHAPLPPNLAAKTERLTSALATKVDLFDRFPLAAYSHSIIVCRRGYKFISAEFQEWSRIIELEFGRDTVERYHQLLLLKLIHSFREIADKKSYQYPDSILPQFHKFFSSILRRIEDPLQGQFLLGKSGFEKDLGVSSQNLIPCGAQLLDRVSGVPRSSIYKQGWRQGWSLGSFMVQKLGGFRPLYQIHMDVRLLLIEFNPVGWTACYRRIAELMNQDHRIKGVCGGSWWFDPQLVEISPRLTFLHDLPVQHGAGVFFAGTDDSSTRDAISNSPVRKRLYDEGKYRPKKYLMVWGRDDLLKWDSKR